MDAKKLEGLLGNPKVTDSLKKAKTEKDVQDVFKAEGLVEKEIDALAELGRTGEKVGKILGNILLPTGIPQVAGFILLGISFVASKLKK